MKRRSFIQIFLSWLASKLTIFSTPSGEQSLFHRREKGELQYAWFTKDGKKRTSAIFNDINDALNLRLDTKDWNKTKPGIFGSATEPCNTTRVEHNPDQGDLFLEEPAMLEWPGDLKLVEFDEGGNIINEPEWAKTNDLKCRRWWERAKVRGIDFKRRPPQSLGMID